MNRNVKIKLYVVLIVSIMTITTKAQNPGGVGTSNLTAWFKADGLTLGNVTSWTTTYPTGGSSTTITGASATYPQATDTPAGDATNYNRTVDFTGNASGSNMTLQKITALNLLDNNSAGGQGTFVGAYCLPNTFTCVGCAYVGYREQTTSSGDGITFRTRMGNGLARMAIGTNQSINGSRDYTQDFGPDIVSYTGNKSGAGTMDSHRKSLAVPVGIASGSAGNQGLFIGGRKDAGSFTHHFDGFISEFIFYDRDLSTAEIIKVHTYLAVKYGVVLDNTGGGTQGDYISTDGTTIWDASNNSGYHNDVMGIGRDDAEGLIQKQSHAYDDTSRIYLSTLAATNVANTGTFSSNVSYVVVGDNKGIMLNSTGANAEVPSACGLYSRLEREWKVTKTNFTENFSFDFKLNPGANPTLVTVSDLRLLVDDDGDFSNGGTTCYFNGDGTGIVISYSNPVITIANFSGTHILNNSTSYITVGSINFVTPLPIDLISFEANCEDFEVSLDWTTSSEINNDYFTVERSADGINFEEIETVDGNGNSFATVNYSWIDNNPINGTSYYRLKQTDYDGKYEYFKMEAANCTSEDEISLYPNPFNNSIYIELEGVQYESNRIEIRNYLGQVVLSNTFSNSSNTIKVEIDENLPKGVYIIQLFNENENIFSKRIIKL